MNYKLWAFVPIGIVSVLCLYIPFHAIRALIMTVAVVGVVFQGYCFYKLVSGSRSA